MLVHWPEIFISLFSSNIQYQPNGQSMRPTVTCVVYLRYKLNRKGVKLAEEMDIPVDGGCITHDDWKLLCSGVGYFK